MIFTLLDTKNPLISAFLRQYRWEIPINFPNSRNDFKDESRPAVKAWLDAEFKENWGGGDDVLVRDQMVEYLLEEFFGPII